MGLVEHEVGRGALTVVEFRAELYACLTARSDALFELSDALLCTDGPVRTLVDLALAPEHRRGHGALYSGINHGRIDVARLRRALTGVPLPRAGDGRLVLAVDVSPWLRPDADTSSDRSFCHTFGRGLGKHQRVPGWPYSIVAALETGRTSWTALLDAIRLGPGADWAAITADQVREVVQRLVDADQWREGDLDRVMRKPVPGEFVFGDPATWSETTAVTVTNTGRYGTATAQAWDRLHPRLTRRAAWLDHEGPLPIIEGTVIHLAVEKLPSGGVNKPVWLWWWAPEPALPTSTGAGRPSCAASTWNTPFAVSSRLSAGQAEAAGLCGGRPLDLARPGRTRPAPPRPPARAGPPPTMGAAGRTEQTHPSSSPAGVQEPPCEDRHASRCTKAHQARPRPPARLEESTGGHPLRRRPRPRHRRVLHPTRPPQGRHQTATNKPHPTR